MTTESLSQCESERNGRRCQQTAANGQHPGLHETPDPQMGYVTWPNTTAITGKEWKRRVAVA